ncbi:MAG: OFA family MFS transporter [Deltaproteobacteria bacterium]|nr:OFA family MFS transporter [Deltaproteobacteria bacterium]
MTATAAVKNRGWSVTFAGTGINLALGILYAWSLFKVYIKNSIEAGGEGAFTWDLQSLNDPYSVCCLVFAFAMILAGKCQDKFGPRLTAFIGGILVGIGFIWVSQTTSYIIWVLGFGVLAGIGIGFGYSAATPPALKWFPPKKTGLIAGLVVSGFGLASVYIAPLAKYLLGIWGISGTMLFFGSAFLIVVCALSTFLVNPPPGYLAVPPPQAGDSSLSPVQVATPLKIDTSSSEMLKTSSFYKLWLIYFIGSGAGLMVIGSVAGMAQATMGGMAFLVVALMAIGNAAGRIIAGMISDRIGRSLTMAIMLTFQALLMFIAISIVGGGKNAYLLVILATLIGFNYGTNLSLIPSFTKDLWGLKNFGTNYGLVFTSWGVGGFVMSRLSQMLYAKSGSYTYSFIVAGVSLVLGAALSLTLRKKSA